MMLRLRRLGTIALLCATALPRAGAQGTSTTATAGWQFDDWWGQSISVIDCLHWSTTSPCGPGARVADLGARAFASGTPAFGTLAASTRAAFSGGSGQATAGASVRTFFWDNFTVASNTLAAGTAVLVRFGIRLDASSLSPPDLGTCGVGGTGGCTRVEAMWHDAGPDGPIMTSTGQQLSPVGGTGGQWIGGSWVTTFVRQMLVGSSQRLDAELRMSSTIEWRGGGNYAAGIDATADFTADVLGSDAWLVTDSGANYASVPEPATLALLVPGVLGVAALRRRR